MSLGDNPVGSGDYPLDTRTMICYGLPMGDGHGRKLSVREFFQRFPTDDACLEHVMEVRYGLRHECAHCNKGTRAEDRREWTFHKLADRKAYSCANCGH